jgi:hypothetical protein
MVQGGKEEKGAETTAQWFASLNSVNLLNHLNVFSQRGVRVWNG